MPSVIGNEDVEAMIAFYERFLPAQTTDYGLVVDCTADHRGLNAGQRKRVAEWSNDVQDRGLRIAICTAVVLPSMLLRGAMTAFDWVSPPRQPRKAVASLLEGVDYCFASLQDAGVAIPPHVRHYRDRLSRASAAR